MIKQVGVDISEKMPVGGDGTEDSFCFMIKLHGF